MRNCDSNKNINYYDFQKNIHIIKHGHCFNEILAILAHIYTTVFFPVLPSFRSQFEG